MMAPGSLDRYVYAILDSIIALNLEQNLVIFNSIIFIIEASFLMCFPAISKYDNFSIYVQMIPYRCCFTFQKMCKYTILYNVKGFFFAVFRRCEI